MMENKNIHIPMVDFKAQYQSIEKEIDVAIKEVLLSGQYILGPVVKEFEGQVAAYCGLKYAIGVASGSDALILALRALDIGPGDEVITTPFTFVATAHAIVHCGAKPVFVDIEPDTFNINLALIEPAITKNTKAIIPVHLYGHPADMDPIMTIAKAYNLYVVEDAAQAFGARYNGRKVGSIGHVGCFSFFPTKNLGCYGDGGAVFTDNDEWASLMDSLRVHGKGSFKYDNVRIGMNSRLDTLQAAILKVKFDAFKKYELNDINKAADFYTEKLKDLVKTPFIPKGYLSSWAQYTIQLQDEKQRDGLQAYLKEQGIPTMVYYPKPMHEQTAYLDLGYLSGDFPVTESLCRRVLSLPMHPYLNMEEINKVCQTILDYLK